MEHSVRMPEMHGQYNHAYFGKMPEYMSQRPCINAFYPHV